MAKSVSFDVEVDSSIFKKDVAKFLTAIGRSTLSASFLFIF